MDGKAAVSYTHLQNCDIDSFEVKELVGEYGFVMKQLAQIKEEKGFMMAQTQ